jgi:streptomycin 6-kinase
MTDPAIHWRVAVEHMMETDTAVIAFGRRNDQPVVIKVAKQEEDESRSAAVLRAFGGKGVVRILDDFEGALLLERITPGDSLVAMATGGHDDGATEVLAEVIDRMSPDDVSAVPTVEEWGRNFERHLAGDQQYVPPVLVEEARTVFQGLCASQCRRRLLHGDLHHGNVLRDFERGWVAIDPKGVVGELEYEIGAALRNPIEQPEVFLQAQRIHARISYFADRLELDADRIRAWAFAQAVLSAVWLIEDGFAIAHDHPWLDLARRIRPR